MVDGKLFKAGTAEELASDPQVRKVYLGQNFELRRSKLTLQNNDSWPDPSEAI
jgi:lipopolysaccharide export system ATP-binding protein